MSARRLYNLPEPVITTARDSLLALLSDLQWHHSNELRVGGVRYSARLLELKRLGYRIEKRPVEVGYEYRLASLRRHAPRAKLVKAFLTEADATEAVNRRLTDSAVIAIASALQSFDINRGKL